MSQQRLSDLSGVGRVTITRIEGAAQSPKLDTIQKLATGMGYPVQALLMDDWADFAMMARGESVRRRCVRRLCDGRVDELIVFLPSKDIR